MVLSSEFSGVRNHARSFLESFFSVSFSPSHSALVKVTFIMGLFCSLSLSSRLPNKLCMASTTTKRVGSKYGRQSNSDHLTPLEANAASCSGFVSALSKALAEARHSSFVRLRHTW